MAGKRQLCIVGGGPAGIGLLWTLAQDPELCSEWSVTVLHDQSFLGGHCATYPIDNPATGRTVPVDIGVQCISPLANPNVSQMLRSGDFPSAAPVVDAPPLTVGCAFPPRDGQPMNWGNFPAYQTGPTFELWSETGMAADCAELQTFIAISPAVGYAGKTLAYYFANNPTMPYTNQQDFIDYFVDPFMTVINGYGAPDLSTILLGDLLPIFGRVPGFDGPLASWSVPGVGWQRFQNGASSWVQAMFEIASRTIDVTVSYDNPATAVWLDPDDAAGQVFVATDADPSGIAYDKVVLAVDMWTNAKLLDCAQNQQYWSSIYEGPLTNSDWQQLQPGTCYIHADQNVLAPDLRGLQQELAQFTAYYATQQQPYDADTTYTTYLVQNVRGGDPAAANLYVTMYGPEQGSVVPQNPFQTEQFVHGMWLPSYMLGAKQALHTAQGVGTLTNVTNAGTNLYFAGNNTTFDSVEGGLVSGMAIANYAFGAPYPIAPGTLTPVAFAMFLYLYLGVMFPQDEATAAVTVADLKKAAFAT
jgi:hypothetical protein